MTYLTLILFIVLVAVSIAFIRAKKKLRQLAKQIRDLNTQNRNILAKKTDFLATASHDLQQPQQALGLFLASINTRTLDEENTRIINKAKDAHSTTSRLLNQLLDISKLDTTEKPKLKLLPLHELIHNIGMKFMPIAACYGVELRIRQRDAYAMSDAIMLERMITNILLNAFRHAKKANVLLTIRKKTMADIPYWNIEIYDTGMGIPKDKQSLIFQEFTQLTKPELSATGLGLGLAIVKRLSNLLHHPVGIRSRLGKGSCFYISLKEETQPVLELIEPVMDSVIRQRMKVAVINENAMLRDSLKTLLSSWGCQAKTFSSSEKALQEVKEKSWSPDALIVDGTLHNTQLNLDDIEDIRTLSGQDMPMILITHEVESIYAKEAQRFGFTLLNNPIEASSLREVLGSKEGY